MNSEYKTVNKTTYPRHNKITAHDDKSETERNKNIYYLTL